MVKPYGLYRHFFLNFYLRSIEMQVCIFFSVHFTYDNNLKNWLKLLSTLKFRKYFSDRDLILTGKNYLNNIYEHKLLEKKS